MFRLSSLYEKYRDAASCEDHRVNASIHMYMYVLYIFQIFRCLFSNLFGQPLNLILALYL